MGPIDALVTVTIIATNATPTLPNFGTPAFLAYHTHNTDYIRTYTSLAGMVSDGFSATEPAYYWASTVLSQSPTVPSFKIIRGSTAVTHMTFTFLVTDLSVGDTIGFTVIGVNGTTTVVNTTATGNATTDGATLAALTPPNGCTMAAGSGTVTLTVTSAGKKVYVQTVLGGTYTDTTASASPSTDLNNALTVDTSFYSVTSEHMDATNITAMAVWAEANKRMNIYSTADTTALNSAAGIGNTLKAAGYTYSYGQFNGTSVQYGASGTGAQRFTSVPGTDTWAYKQLAGVTVDKLTATQITNANGNNLNYYIAVSNVNITLTGIDASGMYADIRRGIDALGAQVQIQVYNLLITQPKVPYDPNGIAMVGGEVASAMGQFTATANRPLALLRNDPGFQPQVILPLIANTTAVDRGNRVLRNMNFVAYAQQGIQTVLINGSVNT